MRVPLHIAPDDRSMEAEQRRYDLHQFMMTVTGGNGFRKPKKDGEPIKRYGDMLNRALGNEVEG